MSAQNPTPSQAECRSSDHLAEIRKLQKPGSKTLEGQMAKAEKRLADLRLRLIQKEAAKRRKLDQPRARRVVSESIPVQDVVTIPNGNHLTLDYRVSQLAARLERLERELGVR